MTAPSPIYCHGAKHLLTGIRDQIMDVVNNLEHETLVDPFMGSGTFAALDTQATVFRGNAGPGAPRDTVSELGQYLVDSGYEDVTITRLPWEAHVGREFYANYHSLLLLDPPRTGSTQYGFEFDQDDADLLLSFAMKWRGPVVIATYAKDMPTIKNNGWYTRYINRENPIRGLSFDYGFDSRPMILWRDARV